MRKAILLVSAVAFALWSGIASAQTPAPTPAPITADPEITAAAIEARKAADEFSLLAKDSFKTGKVPRQSDPSVKRLLDTILNTDLLKTKMLHPADQLALSAWLTSIARVQGVYLLAGTGTSDMTKLDQSSVERMVRNVARYQPEAGRVLDAVAVMGMASIDFIDASDESSADMISRGYGALFTLELVFISYDPLEDDWRKARLGPLTELASKSAPLLKAKECKSILDVSRRVQADSTKAVRVALQAFDAATKCGPPAKAKPPASAKPSPAPR